jgi:beta-N-acetylhexosaminidase
MKTTLPLNSAAQKALDGFNWKQLLRQVLCPARMHLPERIAHDFGSLFLHDATVDLAEFKAGCPIPPLLCGDFESGPSLVGDGPFGFPSMSGCGTAGDVELAYQMGLCSANELRQKGIHWSLGPVVDIALDIDSPMVGLRAAGDTPDQVIPATRGFLRGLQAGGVAATAKHFPGDGFNSLDQHNTTPVNRMSREAWEPTYGRTFRAAIEAGVSCIMPGHIGLAWADQPDAKRGVEPPATVSRNVLTGLLREELGFDGLIVSDAMGMGGVAGFMNPYEAVAAFFEAGGDCALFVRYDEFFEREMERCLIAGLLQEETLYLRAQRVLALKQRVGLFDQDTVVSPEVASISQFAEAARAMTERCVQIVRDLEDLLPICLKPDARVLHVVICNNYDEVKDSLDAFAVELGNLANEVTTWIDPGPEKLWLGLRDREFDLVVASLANAPSYGANVIRLHGPPARNLMDGWMHLGTPVVWVQHGHPFHHRQYPVAMGTVINTYAARSPHALRRLAEGIFGKIQLPRSILTRTDT